MEAIDDPIILPPRIETVRYEVGTAVERAVRACTSRRRADQNVGGPPNVRASLLRGLDLIGEAHEERWPLRTRNARIGVLSGLASLRLVDALTRRASPRLVVGPNVFSHPTDAPRPLRDRMDLVLVPSQWTADGFEAICPDLVGRVRVWAAGIDTDFWTPGEDAACRSTVIVYVKRTPEGWEGRTLRALDALGQPFSIVRYGHYTHVEYREALRQAKAMVWLSPTESQGLALAEAWSCGVPTLCADSARLRSTLPAIFREASSAPYLTARTGRMLDMDEELDSQMQSFLRDADTFDPRPETVRDFSLSTAARAYADLFHLR